MGIKIKHKDPKTTEFNNDDLVINVKTGDIFYKSEKNLFKLQGDNLNTTQDISFFNNISASKAFINSPGIGKMKIGSKENNVFEVGNKAMEVLGSIIPKASSEPNYDLGSIDNPWREVYVSENSFRFVKREKGVGHSKIGTSFIIGQYKSENTKTTTSFSKQNVDDLKQGKSISGSGDLRVAGKARIDNQLTLNAGLNITAGGITGSIDGGSF